MLSDLDLSCLLQETIPDTSNPNEKIPCIITKYLNYNEIFVQFKKYRVCSIILIIVITDYNLI